MSEQSGGPPQGEDEMDRRLRELTEVKDVSGAGQRAVEIADAILAVDPGNDDALYVRSNVLLRDGQSEEALRIAERLPAAGSRHLRLLARAREATGDSAGALAAIRLLLAESPDDADVLRVEAIFLSDLGRHDEAVTAIRRSVELMPTANGLSLESFYLAHLGRYEEAVVALRRSIELEPAADPLEREASYLGKLGRYEEAVTALRRSIELEPTARRVEREAIYLEKLGRNEEALTAIRRSIGLKPTTIGFNLEAHYLGKLGRLEEALAAARRSVELQPTATGLRWEAIYLMGLGRYDEALVVARRRLELAPAEQHAQLLVGLAAGRAGDLDLAEQAYRAAIADDPRDPLAAGELALLLAKADRWVEAETIIAGVPSDIANPAPLASWCREIEAAALSRAERSLDRLDRATPAPETLADLARWLGICVRMRETAIARDPGVTAPEIDGRLTAIVETLHSVAARPDSDFARIFGDLGARLEL